MTIYPIRYQDATEAEKTAFEAGPQFWPPLAFALVVCHVLLVSAWQDTCTWLRAALKVVLVLAIFARLWVARKLDRAE